MSRGSFKPSVKHILHESGERGVSLGATGSSFLVNRKLLADKDTCINRENPLRNVGKRFNLVVGYDHRGTFDRAIPAGNTHGYWTLANNNGFGDIDGATAVDGGGFGITSSYLARTLLQFDLNEAGITRGDSIVKCFLDLEIKKSGTAPTSGITLDFHRFHAGVPVAGATTGSTSEGQHTVGATGVGDKHNWDDSATWYEWKYSGLHELFLGTTGAGTLSATGPGTGPYGTSDLDFVYTIGSTKDGGIASGVTTYGQMYPPSSAGGGAGGIYAWDFQGLGATGGRGAYGPNTIGSCTGSDEPNFFTTWADFSDGDLGSNTLQLDGFCNMYGRAPSIYLKPGDIRRGKKVRVDVTLLAYDAIKYYGGHMRILVKLRDDHKYGLRDESTDRAFIVFQSREGLIKPNSISTEIGNPISISNTIKPKSGTGPTIDVTFRDLT